MRIIGPLTHAVEDGVPPTAPVRFVRVKMFVEVVVKTPVVSVRLTEVTGTFNETPVLLLIITLLAAVRPFPATCEARPL